MPITREQIQTTSGGSDDKIQVFFENIFKDYKTYNLSFNIFNVPQYTTVGGTLLFYEQDPLSIFTNLVRPFIRFTFTANTSSLTGDTSMIHDIYRLDHETYMSYYDAFKQKSDESTTFLEEINEIDENGVSKRKFITTSTRNKDNKLQQPKIGNANLSIPEKKQKNPGFNIDTDVNIQPDLNDITIDDVQKLFDIPIYTASTSTSAITTSVYDLFIDEYVKKTGNTKTLLFQDKSQYLVDTRFSYKIYKSNTLLDYFVLTANSISSTTTDSNTLIEQENVLEYFQLTDSYKHTIDRGDFEGLNIKGRFFSYFIVPDKPRIENPVVQGNLTTFTPEFFWSNGEGCDEYVIQITYNTADTVFSGQVFSYPIEKLDIYKEKYKTTNSLDVTDTKETDKTIRKYQVPIKPNKFFRYRVGNIKTIKNIFGVKQSVVTFSDAYTANTSSSPLTTYVYSESDSPYIEEIQGWVTPPSVVEDISDSFILSGTVSGSVVTGATITLTYPNSNYVIQTTDLTGNYIFEDLQSGAYTMTTYYRGYDIDVRNITLTGDTALGFKLNLLWGNAYDTWGKMANENYFT